MSDTLNFCMPLLDAAQAQKHVTVNEALVRADILAARHVVSRSLSVPPASPVDGTAYIVGAGATGDWSGAEGQFALFLNGGWEFSLPWEGADFWLDDEGTMLTRRGGEWVDIGTSASASAAATACRVIETDHVLANAAVSVTGPVIPDKAIVLGVTGRVLTSIGGVASWSIGVTGSPDRYGSGYGTGAGSFAHGVTGQPQAYFGATPLVITSDGPAFSAGSIRLAVHCIELAPPI